ncbi:hypothetical protein PG994_005034 [Apiospora phragmitis]|uniref:Uncharacterized protein n=1 Tax=Apiospora phragmitis TaxID=2905665 RepID=A0ABR1VVC3_9PEZI
MNRVPSLYWWTPFLMVSSFVVGIIFAVGHHLFYASLEAKPAQTGDYTFLGLNYSGQQFNIAVGTAFGFLVKAAFVLSVSTAYIQLFWRQVKYNTEKGQPSTVKHTDSLYSGLDSLISLLNAPVMYKYPVLFLVAATAWLVPIASIIAPATLSVSLIDGVLEVVMENVPHIDFLNLNYAASMGVYRGAGNGSNYYSYNDPSQILKQLSMAVVAQKAILPITPPFPNASWSLESSGPNLVCHPAQADNRLRILRSIAAYTGQDRTSCDRAPTYLAWHEPYNLNSTMAGPYYRDSLDNQSSLLTISNPDSVFNLPWDQRRVKQDSTLYIASLPNTLLRKHFPRSDNGNDCVLGSPGWENKSENPLGIYGGDETIVQCQLYNSTYLTKFQYARGLQDIDIKISELGETVPVTAWVRGPNTTLDLQENCATLQEPKQRLLETLETMFRNFTVSLMSSTMFQPNYSDPTTAPPKVPVTRTTSQTVYVYAPDKLWAAYGAAAAATLAGVVLGLIATVASCGSYTGSLSTILRITRNAELSVKIEESDLDGKGALPVYLARATMRVGASEPRRRLSNTDLEVQVVRQGVHTPEKGSELSVGGRNAT